MIFYALKPWLVCLAKITQMCGQAICVVDSDTTHETASFLIDVTMKSTKDLEGVTPAKVGLSCC